MQKALNIHPALITHEISFMEVRSPSPKVAEELADSDKKFKPLDLSQTMTHPISKSITNLTTSTEFPSLNCKFIDEAPEICSESSNQPKETFRRLKNAIKNRDSQGLIQKPAVSNLSLKSSLIPNKWDKNKIKSTSTLSACSLLKIPKTSFKCSRLENKDLNETVLGIEELETPKQEALPADFASRQCSYRLNPKFPRNELSFRQRKSTFNFSIHDRKIINYTRKCKKFNKYCSKKPKNYNLKYKCKKMRAKMEGLRIDSTPDLVSFEMEKIHPTPEKRFTENKVAHSAQIPKETASK